MIERLRITACICISLLLHGGLLAVTGAARTEGDYWLPSLEPASRTKMAALTVALRRGATDGRFSKSTPPADTADKDRTASASHGEAESRSAAVLAEESHPLIAIPVLRYYKPEELSVRPELAIDLPHSSNMPWTRFAQGRSVIRIYIDEEGRVDRVSVTESNLPPEYEALVIEAVTRGAFKPGELDGHRVKSQVDVEVTIEAKGGTTQPPSPTPSATGN